MTHKEETMVERLIARWTAEIGNWGSDDIERDARFFLLAIADELEAQFGITNRAAAWLRREAGEP